MAFILGGNTSIYLASVGGSPPLPNPAQILGVNYYDHWDYTDPTTLSVTGTDINSCTSKGINGAVMASTGTTRPKILAGQINGFDVADFDGINDFASVAASTAMYNFLHNGAGGTVIVISRVNDANPNTALNFINNNQLASSTIGYGLTYDDRASLTRENAVVSIANNGTATRSCMNLTANNFYAPQVYNLLFDLVDSDNATAADRSKLSVNGGANVGTNALTAAVSASNATDNMTLGKLSGGVLFYLKGQIAEVLIANTIITSQQQTDLENFYNFKYGTFPVITFLTGITNHIFTGDSIMSGSNATAGNSFRELITTNYPLTSTDLSLGGSGVWREIFGLNTLGYTRSTTTLFIEAGLNDVRRNSTYLTFNKIESCLKTIIKKHFALTSAEAGGGSVTRVGSWTPINLTAFGGASALGTFSSTMGNTSTYSFTGDNCFVVFSASAPSIARGNCEVRIDGILVETITDLDERSDGTSDGVYDNLRVPDTRFYSGLSAGAHTIEVKVISAVAVFIDQFGTLDAPSNLGSLSVIQIPYIVDYSKAGLDQANDTIIDQANDLRESIVDEFIAKGYRIEFMPIMAGKGGFYNLSNVDPIDDVHPTNAGHLQIYNSIIQNF